MKKIIKEDGIYLFHIDDLILEKQISKNEVLRETKIDFKVMERYMNGTCSRLDLSVLARLCDYFQRNLSELIEYIPNQKIE